ncbi:tyrosine-type recombinase/integrase [Nonomuraea sp. NPDC050451]|uniref:tyrosine-type recombinase/integrase n=1 Tax=Nonomuraea sp. NPDC050451 TaxID=3364364 RepID=UPI0037A2DEDD
MTTPQRSTRIPGYEPVWSSMAQARFWERMERSGARWQETGLVFTTASGRPIEPSNFRRSFAKACIRAGVRKVHVHATRKTCESLLVALDVHPRVAMQILRHSQIAVTMNIYSEVSSEAHTEGAEALRAAPRLPNIRAFETADSR